MTLDERLAYFSEQVNCVRPIYTWQYGSTGQLLKSNCPCEAVLDTALSIFNGKKDLASLAARHRPFILGAPIGLVWLADCIWNGDEPERTIILGPVFTTEVSLDSIYTVLTAMQNDNELNVSLAWQQELGRALEQVPTISVVLMNEYTVLLHHCLTGEKLHYHDIIQCQPTIVSAKTDKREKRDRHQIYRAEKGLLRMVREGDLNYRDAVIFSEGLSDGVPVQSRDPLRQAKTSIIVFTSLCTRAAIEGGLSPEQAYSLGDNYIQSAESSKDISELSALSNIMYDDFIHRVHDCRVNPQYSKPIQECCDYIELYVEDKLGIAELAARVGYTEYYLSRKFKEETGVSLNNYIKFAKVERAKFLLSSTDTSIQEISNRLGFCSRSYFGSTFQKIVGCSPADYREGNGPN